MHYVRRILQWLRPAKKQFSTDASAPTAETESIPTTATTSDTANAEKSLSMEASTTAELGLQIRHL